MKTHKAIDRSTPAGATKKVLLRGGPCAGDAAIVPHSATRVFIPVRGVPSTSRRNALDRIVVYGCISLEPDREQGNEIWTELE